MNFDRVADIYDETRALPQGVAERVADCIMAATDADSRSQFLELGIGTGRIALPFIQRGISYTGVDISREMMSRLRVKVGDAPNVTVIEGDVTRLPLPDGAFDVVLSVHLLHLVPEWRTALQEARRVLRPDGYLIMGGDSSLPGDPANEFPRQWRAWVEEAGVELRPEHGSMRAVEGELTAQGARIAHYRPAWWERSIRPSHLLEEARDRVFSATWNVPDDTLMSVHRKMVQWSREQYGELDRAMPSRQEFTVSVSRFPPA